ncbi:fibrillarin-like rRNA/tRNA 2'-O-methyltransferase [Methanohalobium sp.]|uniref:fibrillarin-like rRNA/tRNA 2'-O-methyltransferase n=1 Tax=Methanohalobium sp. TaxID=2837493 RepID=UPI0025EF84DB|nr:fibrillarin-like rRNA/tRNA 2'-O-methyltransferase [Methanohalobium sp.]
MDVKEISQGIFELSKGKKKQLATRNLNPGNSVYSEPLVVVDDVEYRRWDVHRSKFGAMILKKFNVPLNPESRVLYLGAASGTTVSHISDIATNGLIYAVEFSSRTMRDLVMLCEKRPNIVPVLADAGQPSHYSHIVEKVDVIFQDVSQPNQAEIAAKNAKAFLKKDGFLLLAIKARSIDTVANPKKIFKEEVKKVTNNFAVEFEILKRSELDPYHEDHLGILARLK